MEKTCFKCREAKSLSDFYKHPRMADGHLGKCKTCCKKFAYDRRRKNIEIAREQDKARYRNNPQRRQTIKERALRWKKINPEKARAQQSVNNAVRDKRLTKPENCEKCGEKKRLQGHHADYSKPLDVLWVCSPCHYKEHHP